MFLHSTSRPHGFIVHRLPVACLHSNVIEHFLRIRTYRKCRHVCSGTDPSQLFLAKVQNLISELCSFQPSPEKMSKINFTKKKGETATRTLKGTWFCRILFEYDLVPLNYKPHSVLQTWEGETPPIHRLCNLEENGRNKKFVSSALTSVDLLFILLSTSEPLWSSRPHTIL